MAVAVASRPQAPQVNLIRQLQLYGHLVRIEVPGAKFSRGGLKELNFFLGTVEIAP